MTLLISHRNVTIWTRLGNNAAEAAQSSFSFSPETGLRGSVEKSRSPWVASYSASQLHSEREKKQDTSLALQRQHSHLCHLQNSTATRYSIQLNIYLELL